MARVYLKGLPTLKAKLIALKEKTQEAVKPAMEQAAQSVVEMMKRQVPFDKGDLVRSIGWTWGDKPKGSIGVASAKFGVLRLTIFAGNATAYYARFVEFGTAAHPQGGSHPGTQHPGTKAQPFFYPSYRANRKAIKAAIAKAIRLAIKEAAR